MKHATWTIPAVVDKTPRHLMNRHRFAPSRSPKTKASLKAPPNYFSPAVQVKLFVLTAVLMLTILLMERARKRENWRWMWAGQQGAAGTAAEGKAETAAKPDGEERHE